MAEELTKAAVITDGVFQGNTSQHAAGNYAVGVDYANRLVIIENESNRHEMFLPGTISDQGSDHPALVFHRLGDSYFLREAKVAGGDVSFSVRNAEMRLTQSASPDQAIVALR